MTELAKNMKGPPYDTAGLVIFKLGFPFQGPLPVATDTGSKLQSL